MKAIIQMKKTKPNKSKILNNVQIAKDTFKMIIDNQEVALSCLPGQFISIECPNTFLRRPFSIAGTDNESFTIIYKIKGEGTKFLSSLVKGDSIDVIGPLGNGFNISTSESLLVGAGVGVAPLIFLSNKLKENSIKYTFVSAFKTINDVINIKESVIITEDGSTNLSGLLTENIKDLINNLKPSKIYSCGPIPVLKYLSGIAHKENLSLEIAMERDFACGIGVCMGCVIVVLENNIVKNLRICKDGPVFDGKIIKW